MSGNDEASEPGDDSGQRRQWQQHVEVVIFPAVALIITGLVIFLSNTPPLIESVQWSLARGVGMYAVAIVAALLLRVVARLSVRLLRFALAALLTVLLVFPPYSGSFDIAYGLVHLVGHRVDGRMYVWALLLWFLVSIPLVVFVNRRMPRV